MKKIAILLLVAASACTMIVWNVQHEPRKTTIELGQVDRTFESKQEVVSYLRFRKTLELTLQSLERGDCSLADATRRVHDASVQWWGMYLIQIAMLEQGDEPLEHVARNLVGHIQTRATIYPMLLQRVQELEAELMENDYFSNSIAPMSGPLPR